jgi:enediyne biosynthesis protein E5
MSSRQAAVSHTRADPRLAALRRFAVAITALNVLGHMVFGFEQAWVQPLAALVTAYCLEVAFESIDAWAQRRPVRFAGGPVAVIDFLLSAHITGLAVAMLLYSGDQVGPIVFATAIALSSKVLLRAPVAGGRRHFFNPSNLGISAALLLFPWVGIAPPYHFTENLPGAGQWIVPGAIVVSGSLLNARLTRKLPLILGWVGGFVLQALLRNVIFGTPLVAALLPITGVAFILYTFYMVTDPSTTPSSPSGQILFGAAVAALYGLLVIQHVVFGLFFALTIVCAARGLVLYAAAWQSRAMLALRKAPALPATPA